MAKNGKSNTFLLGRIYERTEQTVKILPVMQKDIQEIKEKQMSAFYERDSLKKRVRKIENTSLSCMTRRAGRFLINILIGRLGK